jgi:hypothetical protein
MKESIPINAKSHLVLWIYFCACRLVSGITGLVSGIYVVILLFSMPMLFAPELLMIGNVLDSKEPYFGFMILFVIWLIIPLFSTLSFMLSMDKGDEILDLIHKQQKFLKPCHT